LRSCPDYIQDDNKLLIKHESGKEFQLYQDKKDKVVLEKRVANKGWRKVNNHKGTLDTALIVARLN
jgi:hypothetical protein